MTFYIDTFKYPWLYVKENTQETWINLRMFETSMSLGPFSIPKLVVSKGALQVINGFSFEHNKFHAEGTCKMVDGVKKHALVHCVQRVVYNMENFAACANEVIFQSLLSEHKGICKLYRTYLYPQVDRIYFTVAFLAERLQGDLSDFKGTDLELHLLILQVAKAIEFVHGKRVILCDFKFENVLVSRSEDGLIARLCDFYGAFIEGTVPPKYAYTYDYASPELLRNKSEITRATDVFAFTVSLLKKVEDLEEPATSLKIIYNDRHTFNCAYRATLEVIRHCTNFKSIYKNIVRVALDPNPVTRPSIQWIRQELERFPVPAAATSRFKEITSELG